MFFINLRGRRDKLNKPYQYAIKWESESRSKFQSHIKKLLKKHWQGHVVFEEFPVMGTRLTLDFYNASLRIAVEVDGDQHIRYNKHFHSKSRLNFIKQLERDNNKEKFCDLNNIRLIRIYESDDIQTPKQLKNFIENYE